MKEKFSTDIIISRIEGLCNHHHVSINKMLAESGSTKSIIDNMKKGSIPSVDKLQRIAEYFKCSIDYLVGNDTADDNNIKFALFNETDGITDEMLEEVKWYARVLAEREKAKREANPQIEITVRQASRDGRPIQTTNLTPQEMEQREAAPLIPEEF